jgi:hypothetical protein
MADDQEEVELHPDLIEMIEGLNKDRRTLLKDKTYENPAQLRQWVAQFLVPRLVEFAEFFGMSYEDTFGFASSNVSEIRRLRKVMMTNFAKLGVKREDLVGADGEEQEMADALQESFHSLITLLDKKLPGDDPDVQKALDAVDEAIENVVEALAPSYSEESDSDDDDDDDGKSGDDAAESGPEA